MPPPSLSRCPVVLAEGATAEDLQAFVDRWLNVPDRDVRLEAIEISPVARPESEWHDDVGPVLWWTFPVCEPPYCGTPLDKTWPGYHTHWTRFDVPDGPPDVAA